MHTKAQHTQGGTVEISYAYKKNRLTDTTLIVLINWEDFDRTDRIYWSYITHPTIALFYQVLPVIHLETVTMQWSKSPLSMSQILKPWRTEEFVEIPPMDWIGLVAVLVKICFSIILSISIILLYLEISKPWRTKEFVEIPPVDWIGLVAVLVKICFSIILSSHSWRCWGGGGGGDLRQEDMQNVQNKYFV